MIRTTILRRKVPVLYASRPLQFAVLRQGSTISDGQYARGGGAVRRGSGQHGERYGAGQYGTKYGTGRSVRHGVRYGACVRHGIRYGAVSTARSIVGGQSVRHGLRYGASVRYGIRYGAVSPARSTMAGGGRFAQSLLLVCNVFLVFVT